MGQPGAVSDAVKDLTIRGGGPVTSIYSTSLTTTKGR